MDKPWLVRYRQFARGRRSVKTVPISAASQAEALKTFSMALGFCKKENPMKFNNVKLISIFEEGTSCGTFEKKMA